MKLKNYFSCIFVFILFFMMSGSCHRVGKASKSFDDNTPGKVVLSLNPDSTPRDVIYYKVDPSGNITDEAIHEIHYFPNKKKYVEGDLKEGKREGTWYAYFENGKVNTEATYEEGKEIGSYKVYRENGKLLFSGQFDKGICTGTWLFYNPDGLVSKKIEATPTTIACGWCPKCRSLQHNH